MILTGYYRNDNFPVQQIHAVRFIGGRKSCEEVMGFLPQDAISCATYEKGEQAVAIKTVDKKMLLMHGDFLIKDKEQKLKIYKEADFHKTFQLW